jgi:hypothetical protein
MLRARLERAYDAWHRTKDDEEGWNQRRSAAADVLLAFNEWACAEGDIPREHLQLLAILGSGLWDLSEGVRSPLMIPASNQGNRTPLAQAVRLGAACAAVDVLSDGQKGKVGESEQEVARTIGMDHGAFHSWRKTFNADGKGPDARKAYNFAMEQLRQQPNPKLSVRDLLGQVIWHGHKEPRKGE